MLGPVASTQFDIDFRLFGIPVKVSPWFLLMGGILGANLLRDDQMAFLLWMVILFVSILVHELGHALTAKAFGYSPRVLLYQFGGLAMYQPHQGYTTLRAILISAAGPAAGMALGVLTIAVYAACGFFQIDPQRYGSFAIDRLIWINIVWSLVNLAPVLPLDGGQISREVLTAIWPRQGLKYSLLVSIVAGALIAAGFLMIESVFGAVLFGILAAQSFQLYQQRHIW